MDQRPPESEQPRNGLPTVTEETRDKFLSELQLSKESTSIEEIHAFDNIENLSLSTLSDVAAVKPDLILALKNSILSGGDSEKNSLNNYANGIAIVLRAFHIQSDYRLLTDLNKLSSEDIESIQAKFTEGIQAFGGGKNMFDAALHAPSIPASQGFLKEIIGIPTKVNQYAFEARYRAGAGLMYRTMETIWQRLYPGQTSSPESPSITPQPDPEAPPTNSI